MTAILVTVGDAGSSTSEFWSGTGGAIIGAALSGVVAVGAAFLAAFLARRHDRIQAARQASARLAVVVYDIAHDLDDDIRPDYDSMVSQKLHDLRQSYIREAPSFTEPELDSRVDEAITWLTEDWHRAFRNSAASKSPPDVAPHLGDRSVNPNVRRMAALSAQMVLVNLTGVLHVWQREGEVVELLPFPDLSRWSD